MTILRIRSIESWPVLSAGFKPFFLAAGAWACFAMLVWVLMLRGVVDLPTAFDPITWHYHELLFGFVAAAIAGFLLTAIPNWTGRLPLQGAPLGMLVLLWLLGRVGVGVSAWTGPLIAAVADLTFLGALLAVVAREILAGRNWRNAPMMAALACLLAANAMIHMGYWGNIDWAATGKRFAIGVVIMLISLIGGRIIPSFTANWLRRQDADRFPAPFGAFDKATLAISLLALLGWIAVGLGPVSGALLVAAAIAHAGRLLRWRGGDTVAEPLLLVLHIGYAWVPLGLLLLGLSAWYPELSSTALHALTAGAMGTMILAVMTRATLGHSKRKLTADWRTVAIYLLVTVATLARIVAPLLDGGYPGMLDLAGTAWCAAFALFTALYLPLFVRR